MEDYLSQSQRNILDKYGFCVSSEREVFKVWESKKHPLIRVWIGCTQKLGIDFESSSRENKASLEKKEFEFYQQLRKELKVKTDAKR